MHTKDFAILNSLVTYAAENVPGGLTPEEKRVAEVVGRAALKEAPLGVDGVRNLLSLGETGHVERELFRHLPVVFNLSDFMTANEERVGWAAAYQDARTGEIRMDIRLHAEASEVLAKDLHQVFDVKALGFAGRLKKPE